MAMWFQFHHFKVVFNCNFQLRVHLADASRHSYLMSFSLFTCLHVHTSGTMSEHITGHTLIAVRKNAPKRRNKINVNASESPVLPVILN